MSERLPISVTRHAVEQARERAGIGLDDVRGDVRRALCQGRIAEERPSFLGAASLAGREAPPWQQDGGSIRYAWNAAESRVYVLRRARCWVVLTLLVPGESPGGPTALEQAFARAEEAA